MARLPRPSLEAIQAFSVFAETMNLSAAARTLAISQPALHAKIRRLAEELDVPLYVRDRRRLILTRHGEVIARHGRSLQAGTKAMIAAMAGSAVKDRVAVAAGEGTFLHLIGGGIQAFRRRHPETRISLLTRDQKGTVEAVVAGRVDIGVIPMDSAHEDVEASTLCQVGQVLVMQRAHKLARRRTVRLRDLEGVHLVVPPYGAPHRVALASRLSSEGVSWKVAVEAGGWELMIEFVRMGMGLAVVNDYCRIPAGLVAVPLPELPKLRFCICHLRGVPPQGAVRAMIDSLLASQAPRGTS